ncbi:MAG: microcompartment protein PduB [Clostridia bacterium]|nr:microcompartment protein PduB [Clostridia bacterium]
MNHIFNKDPSMPEYVGRTVLDTIGLVIPSVDASLRAEMKLTEDDVAVGVISSRTGAAGQICAVDEAVKNTNARLVSVELPRDTKGWGGHGNYIVLGGRDVSDVRQAVKIALELTERNAGEVYINDAGHLEFAYSASAGEALAAAFDAPLGRAFGFMAGSPAAIGLVMADKALKSADVSLICYMTPDRGTSHSNEVIIAFTGDAAAVKTAVLTAREVGLELISAMDEYPSGPSMPYLN